jgi:hypothetical protein
VNTPAHAVANLLILGRRERPRAVLPIALGAMVPDLPLVVFYAFEKLVMGSPEWLIWGLKYHLPGWQVVFDATHSLPLLGLALIALKALPRLAEETPGDFPGATRAGATALVASMALHALGDLALHHDDAHRHFWPLSDFRFASPVSYWDPRFHGQWVALAEVALVVVGTAVLLRRLPGRSARLLLSAILTLYLGYLGYVLVVWV